MTTIYKQRMSAQIEGDFVIFLIGMRINKPWKIHKWYPVFHAMPPMLKELSTHPESGFFRLYPGWIYLYPILAIV